MENKGEISRLVNQLNNSKISKGKERKIKRKIAKIYELQAEKFLEHDSEMPSVSKASEYFHLAGLARLQSGDIQRALKDFRIARDYSPHSTLKIIENDLEKMEKIWKEKLMMINKTTGFFIGLSFVLALFLSLGNVTGFAISESGSLNNYLGISFFLTGIGLGIFLIVKNAK